MYSSSCSRTESLVVSLKRCAMSFRIPPHLSCLGSAPFPPADLFVAWNVDPDGAVLIADGLRNVVLRLIEGENGLYMTEPGVLPAFYLMLPYDEDGMGGEVPDE